MRSGWHNSKAKRTAHEQCSMKNGLITREPATLMFIVSPLDGLFEDYSIGPPTLLGPEQNPVLLLPDPEGTSEVLTQASYQTGDDEGETVHTTTKTQRLFTSRISRVSDRQAPEALSMLIQSDTAISCWLCRNGHVMYCGLYLTLEQQLSTVDRNFEYLTAADTRPKRLSMQNAQEVDPVFTLLVSDKPVTPVGL